MKSLLNNEEPGCANYYQDRLRPSWNSFVKNEFSLLTFYNNIISTKRKELIFKINVVNSDWNYANTNDYILLSGNEMPQYTELK